MSIDYLLLNIYNIICYLRGYSNAEERLEHLNNVIQKRLYILFLEHPRR